MAEQLQNASKAVAAIEPQPVPKMSDEEREQLRQERINSEETKKRDIAIVGLANSAGGERYMGYKFGAYETTTKEQDAAKSACEEWGNTLNERLKAREGLILWGPIGTGKDHLAFAAVARGIKIHGVTAAWTNGRQLFGQIRDRIEAEAREADLMRDMERPQVLVISDPLPPLGNLTQHQADWLYRIVDSRYAKGKITVVTINVDDNADADSRLGAPIWDRLCHSAWKVHCNWASHRKPAREIK